jgi:hypothetical protein
MGCVLHDRNNEYGGPEDSFGVIANFWSVYLGRKVYPHDVAMMMSLLKIARIKANKSYGDGYVDLAGYAACGAECAGGKPASKPKVDEEPEFKSGDKVEVQMMPDSSTWTSGTIMAVYLDKDTCEWRYCVDCDDGWAHLVVPSARVRPVSAHKAEDCEEPEFKPGDHLILTYPNGDERSCVYVGESLGETAFCLVRYDDDGTTDDVPVDELRRVPKRAEGCEELVQKDAPQTPRELYRKIIASNPATFEGHTPTGEELAELAEEEGHG